ncbi:nitrile hydratase subunit beta [Roseobacter sinensis]|uniref:Nitrile hydratase subunit beta n=1 Tax=Roseobacter sinensis TaxID=2931391 RepID=A0ABT3BB62_9RHOB|nr:nitrile hydratase subunit beta [Roseobacter sp. WL0113]MCV3270404.1 nitrile hydratase subunit beta [Roseobacter sp. WL0113]
MTRPHDMGGRYGDGPVVPEPETLLFHAEWHKRALAITLAAGAHGKWNLDVSRHAREGLAPADYARFSYYEKWIAALADLLIESDLVSRDELAGAAAAAAPMAETTLRAEAVADVLAKGGPATRPSNVEQRFQPGDPVRTRRIAANTLVDGGHTRLPQYAAGATGRVIRYHGTHVLPDSSAHRLGDAAEPLYAVAFPATELWSHPEHPRDEVILDLWQSYLEPA